MRRFVGRWRAGISQYNNDFSLDGLSHFLFSWLSAYFSLGLGQTRGFVCHALELFLMSMCMLFLIDFSSIAEQRRLSHEGAIVLALRLFYFCDAFP